MPETRGIFSYLTARENLEIARWPGLRWPMESVLERFPKLRELLDRKGRLLSGGEQQMLAIARSLLTGPSCSSWTSRPRGWRRWSWKRS